MENVNETPAVALKIEQLSWWELVKEIVQGIGIIVGMTILWGLEAVRNTYFGVLDRLGVKPHRKRASAFPPGRPKRRMRTKPHHPIEQ